MHLLYVHIVHGFLVFLGVFYSQLASSGGTLGRTTSARFQSGRFRLGRSFQTHKKTTNHSTVSCSSSVLNIVTVKQTNLLSKSPPIPCSPPCPCPSSAAAGAAGAAADRDVPADAGAAAAGREVPPPHRPAARRREAAARRLHEQKRRLHQPAGAGP